MSQPSNNKPDPANSPSYPLPGHFPQPGPKIIAFRNTEKVLEDKSKFIAAIPALPGSELEYGRDAKEMSYKESQVVLTVTNGSEATLRELLTANSSLVKKTEEGITKAPVEEGQKQSEEEYELAGAAAARRLGI